MPLHEQAVADQIGGNGYTSRLRLVTGRRSMGAVFSENTRGVRLDRRPARAPATEFVRALGRMFGRRRRGGEPNR